MDGYLRTADRLRALRPKAGSFALTFMGQAGFIINDCEGGIHAIDLYLSDCADRLAGFKRLMPHLLEPEELRFDTVIATHSHCDHFDEDSMKQLCAPAGTRLLTSSDGLRLAEGLGIRGGELMTPGSVHRCGAITVEAILCDHGELAPDAVGLLITVCGKHIYITGDTCLRLDRAPAIAERDISIMIAPINGAFGNLNEDEAVSLAEAVKPGLTVPCHFWNFAEHGGDPGLFMRLMRERLPDRAFTVMALGETLIFD